MPSTVCDVCFESFPPWELEKHRDLYHFDVLARLSSARLVRTPAAMTLPGFAFLAIALWYRSLIPISDTRLALVAGIYAAIGAVGGAAWHLRRSRDRILRDVRARCVVCDARMVRRGLREHVKAHHTREGIGARLAASAILSLLIGSVAVLFAWIPLFLFDVLPWDLAIPLLFIDLLALAIALLVLGTWLTHRLRRERAGLGLPPS
ncbi:MAG TPA: hypothetical protein VGR51_08995 [Thermoplasmata archaeon]|nr:hypothetical protein [Thermoplasmata archaeon]